MLLQAEAPVKTYRLCDTEVSVIKTSEATEIFACAAPIAAGASRNQCVRQTRVIYDSLAELLAQQGATLADVVTERVFFREIGRDWSEFQEIRAEYYHYHGLSGRLLPAVTYLGQPPCHPGQDVELMIYAVRPASEGTVRVESLKTHAEHTTAKLVEMGSSRHLYLNSLLGQNSRSSLWGSFRQQSDIMWASALEILRDRGVAPEQVLRSSFYVGSVERDDDAWHELHDALLPQQKLPSWPTMAVQGGQLYPPNARCGMDLHALLAPDAARIEPIQRAATGEAASSVSGVKLSLPERTCLYLSATATADEDAAGESLRPAVEQMLSEAGELLKEHGASFQNVTQAVTRLRSPELAAQYEPVCASLGLADVPHAVVGAKLCRPKQLAELELTAIVPTA